MGTKLGDVWVQLRLDTTQAKRDLDEVGRGVPGAPRMGAPAAPMRPATWMRPDAGKTRSETQHENYLKQLAGAVIKKAGGGLQGSPATAVALGVMGQASEFIPPAARNAFLTAGKAAVAYGIVSETTKVLPSAFALGKELAGLRGSATGGDAAPTIEAIERTLDELRSKFVAFEASITSVVAGMQETNRFTNAVRRLTGQVPNTEHYFVHSREIDQARKELDAKFDSWKAKEAPFNWGVTLVDYFKRALTK